MIKLGERVGAILKADETTVYMLGFGKYVGDETPPENVGGFNAGRPNPKIDLDNGKSVFGCECWWGSEADVKRMIMGREVVEVDIDDFRRF